MSAVKLKPEIKGTDHTWFSDAARSTRETMSVQYIP
jgi:hypothetical protein